LPVRGNGSATQTPATDTSSGTSIALLLLLVSGAAVIATGSLARFVRKR
jgi:hypothetical protein